MSLGLCQHVGGGGAAGDRFGARELAEQIGEEALVGCVQATGKAASALKRRSSGFLESEAIRRRGVTS